MSVYNLLPETIVFIFKTYLTVVSTLTQVYDTELFGLPMDSIYRREVDDLRKQNRKVAELTAFATTQQYRWNNLCLYLFRLMYWCARYHKINDLLITVNPKHVEFYKSIFLFEKFGPLKHYPRVDAPAIALRLNLDDIEGRLKKVYNALEFDCNLYAYFHKMQSGTNGQSTASFDKGASTTEFKRKMNTDTVNYFFNNHKEIISGLTEEAVQYLKTIYTGCSF